MPETTQVNASNPRNSQWFMVAAFSTIALVAITSSFEDDIKDEEKHTKWAVSAVSLGLTFSTLAVFANFLLKDNFVGTPIEGGLAALTAAFWAAVLPAIMDPENNLAIDSVGARVGARGINNNNLFFFSWGSFVMSFMVLFGYVNHLRGSNDGDQGSIKMFSWAGLLVTSFVVMIAASRQFDDFQCDKDKAVSFHDDFCDRTTFAVSLGAISTLVSLVWLSVGKCCTGRMGFMMNTALVWLMMVLWVFGIIYITFGGDKAAAADLGNLYFFSWGSFCLCVSMAMASLQSMFGEDCSKETEKPKEKPKDDAMTENKGDPDKIEEQDSIAEA